MSTTILAAEALVKSFGGVKAVRGVSFDVCEGEVHAIVGENGAGKSTLIKMLCGVERADTGTFSYRGKPVTLESPAAAQALGIQAIHQELELAGALTVAENIFLGQWPTRFGFVDWKLMNQRAREVLAKLGAHIDPTERVQNLKVSDRQVVEISRAIVRHANVLIMDEPTAALSLREVKLLFERVDALREMGVGIVYISHHLDEVLKIADRITVMRDGSVVERVNRGNADRNYLVSKILGRELERLTLAPSVDAGEPIVDCQNLSVDGRLANLNFRVRAGEIVGFFGLVGAGQTTLAEALFGLRAGKADSVRMGSLARLPHNCREAISNRIGYVPADRKHEGVALGLSIRENIILPALGRLTRFGFIDQSASREIGDKLISEYDIRCRSGEQLVRDLSGGNQQKVALAKWGTTDSSILILDQPTRGVDVGAKAEIYRLLRQFADGGRCCLLMSSDAEEIVTACDRTYVMSSGAIKGEVSTSGMSVDNLIAAVI